MAKVKRRAGSGPLSIVEQVAALRPRKSYKQEMVFEKIRAERRLQDHLFGDQDDRSVGDFILIAEEYLTKAKRAFVNNPLSEAIDRLSPRGFSPRQPNPLNLLKKVAAVLVKCLEQHGV